MIIEIPDDNSIVKWKKNDKEDWKSAEISDLIKEYEGRPIGDWITVKQDTVLGTFEVKNKVCDQCNHATKYEYPFCPWCGADMKGGAE